MSEPEPINREAVLIYLNDARDALRNATALLLTLDLTRSKHSGVMSAFHGHFVKPGLFSIQDSQAYGNAFELRNVTDYEMVGKADETQAHTIFENAGRFVEHCETFLTAKGCL